MKEIQLSRGYKAIIDDEDFEEVSKHKWSYNHTGYAQAYIDGKYVRLHRFLMKPKLGQFVDHKNHDKLDNRRENLRVCTRFQNSRNMQVRPGRRFKGVSLHRCGRYRARVGTKTVGWGDTEEDAARLYNAAATAAFGEFACINKL